ncbi:hypothetical protein [Psychroserpens mesophilus]|uniref:hypothetical protein n=1 Tax=Psychroserpens mesophilus TaxID=325473 RepID=UPI00058C4814|nr:hypothetical protein [Psychroserpens mesophilus]
MKATIIFLFLTLVSCKENKQNLNHLSGKNESENISITLPELENWKEMYSNEIVKNRFDENTTNDTEILGVYLGNQISERIDSIETMDFDDYAMFFKIKKEQKRKIKNSDLERIFNIQVDKSSIEVLDLEYVINYAHSDTTLIKTEKPYLLYVFQNHENVYSAIKLIKPFKDDHKDISIYVYNLINIDNHLIHSGYYMNFDGLKSFQKVKDNNEKIISEFIKVNSK